MKIIDIIKGATGIGSIQLLDIIPSTDNLTEILKLATQIIIAVVTLWSLLKKKKK